ncbi:MAG TPA: TadG family pilus assembly protein [Humisphaera sp.]
MYAVTAMTAMLAIGSLAVDLGRVVVAQSEMLRAVDAAARAASVYLPSDTAGARAAAIAVAAQNSVDGQPLVLQSGDVVFGRWDSTTGTFDTASMSPNAVRITAQRTAARGTAIQLPVAAVLGKSSHDIVATQTTTYAGTLTGIIGLTSFYADRYLFVASYNSANTTSPSTWSYWSSGILGSNGNVRSGTSGDLHGTLTLGPSGSRSYLYVHGSTTYGSTDLVAPTSPAWSPGTNPGGVASAYTASGSVTLAAGTYYFTSLYVRGDLTFAGPATLYINGDVSFDDYADLRAYGNVPSNLKIYVIGTRSFGDLYDDNVDIVADVEAPSTTVRFRDGLRFYGRLIAKTITVDDYAEFYYDEALGTSSTTGGIVTTVK